MVGPREEREKVKEGREGKQGDKRGGACKNEHVNMMCSVSNLCLIGICHGVTLKLLVYTACSTRHIRISSVDRLTKF